VESGDLIHADRHGAVVVPADKVDEMMKALEALMEREARIIRAANDPEMTVERIKEAMRG
jgi:regulator of RNase E activity RraA